MDGALDARVSFDPRQFFVRNRRALSYAVLGIGVVYQMGAVGALLKFIVVACIGLVAMMVLQQEQLIYAAHIGGPSSKNPQGYRSPLEWNMPYEDVNIADADGVVIHGWFIKQEEPLLRTAPTVLYLHGNAGNIGIRMPHFLDLHNKLKVNILAIDYRGYGASAGQPSEPGLKQDADASLAWLLARSDIDHHKLVVYGQSLGGAVAAYLAASEAGRTHVAGVIFENTFTSTINMAMSLFPFLVPLKWVLPLVVKSPWNSAAEVQSIIAPIMFVSGKLDTIVPPPHMAELHRLAQSEKRFHEFADGGHNDTPMKGGARYIDNWRDFLRAISWSQDAFSMRPTQGERTRTRADS